MALPSEAPPPDGLAQSCWANRSTSTPAMFFWTFSSRKKQKCGATARGRGVAAGGQTLSCFCPPQERCWRADGWQPTLTLSFSSHFRNKLHPSGSNKPSYVDVAVPSSIEKFFEEVKRVTGLRGESRFSFDFPSRRPLPVVFFFFFFFFFPIRQGLAANFCGSLVPASRTKVGRLRPRGM